VSGLQSCKNIELSLVSVILLHFFHKTPDHLKCERVFHVIPFHKYQSLSSTQEFGQAYSSSNQGRSFLHSVVCNFF
jgi:hypothetical protein